MGNISLFLAFSAGLLSFLSPCVLPLIPGYLSYLTGSNLGEQRDSKAKRILLYKSIFFVMGFTLIFILMGASITSLGKLFIKHRLLVKRISGIIMIIFGIHTTGIFTIKKLYMEKRAISLGNAEGFLGALIMGLAFAAGWTPCIGPILGSILLYAGSHDTIGRGVLLLTSYSLGLGLPFIGSALLFDKLSFKLKSLNKYLKPLSIISGIIMIILGILIFTDKLVILTGLLS